MNTIVVLNYNDSEETIRFCNQVKDFKSVDLILVVDNCSTDNSLDVLNNLSSDKIKILSAKQNKGYAAGNNVGLRYVLDNKLEGTVVISNPDIYVSDSSLTKILETLNDKSIGIATGLITTNGRITSNFGWYCPSYWELSFNLFLSLYKIKRWLGWTCYLKYPEDEDNVYCNCVSGCFFCMTTETLQKVGLFDERTFLFGEENILGFRLKQLGLKTCIVTAIKVEHDQHHSINKNRSKESEDRGRRWTLDSMQVYIKYYLKKGFFYQKLYTLLYKLSFFERQLLRLIMNNKR